MIHHPGRRSAPPGNTLAPPTMLIPTYPSSALNNYYHQSNLLFLNDQNNMHTSTPISSALYDPNVLLPSASQSHVLSLHGTPPSPLQPIPNTRSLHDQFDTVSHSSVNYQQNYVTPSPLIFQSPSPFITANACTQNTPLLSRHVPAMANPKVCLLTSTVLGRLFSSALRRTMQW
jgi:hypothetical protein